MKRHTQVALWVILAPVFGAIQATASFSLIMLSVVDLRNHDLPRVLVGLSFAYGGGWFIPALIVSDLAMLRRTLSGKEFLRYVSLIAITALAAGFILPGVMVMLGYPTTACAILVYAFIFRKRRLAVAGEKLTLA